MSRTRLRYSVPAVVTAETGLGVSSSDWVSAVYVYSVFADLRTDELVS